MAKEIQPPEKGAKRRVRRPAERQDQAAMGDRDPLAQGALETGPHFADAQQMLQLQRTIGNRAVVHRLAGQLQREDGATPLAGDEYVLTKDGQYAQQKYVAWFQGKVKGAVEPWGLSFTKASVTLRKVKFDSGELDAVTLKWDGAWGAQPATKEVPFSMAPIAAKASVTGITCWAGRATCSPARRAATYRDSSPA
jgi:hypothetical protein